MTGSSMVGRRAFVAGSVGALVATAAAIGLAAPAGAATTATAWTLSTTWSIPRGARGRLSCRCAACRAHSENKIYATSAAATIGRAHRNCLCIPIQYPMAADAYAAIFATADQADRRDPAVQAVLATSASAPPTPTPPATSPSTSPSGPSDARSASIHTAPEYQQFSRSPACPFDRPPPSPPRLRPPWHRAVPIDRRPSLPRRPSRAQPPRRRFDTIRRARWSAQPSCCHCRSWRAPPQSLQLSDFAIERSRRLDTVGKAIR
jgi:hypothetical protein